MSNFSHEMLRYAIVSDKPGGLSVQPPPPPGKLAAQLKSPFGDYCFSCYESPPKVYNVQMNLCFTLTWDSMACKALW